MQCNLSLTLCCILQHRQNVTHSIIPQASFLLLLFFSSSMCTHVSFILGSNISSRTCGAGLATVRVTWRAARWPGLTDLKALPGAQHFGEFQKHGTCCMIVTWQVKWLNVLHAVVIMFRSKQIKDRRKTLSVTRHLDILTLFWLFSSSFERYS